MIDLESIFTAVTSVMIQNRLIFNQADTDNGNHGDHMVEIFEVAARAAREKSGEDLAEAMDYAGQSLAEKHQNGSAQIYAHGLAQFAQQFRISHITLNDLVSYVHNLLNDQKEAGETSSQSRHGDVLKSLLSGLAAWQKTESSEENPSKLVDIGYLFELGMTYMQARQRNGTKLEILADAAASASPLGQVSYRYESGKLALKTLFQAMENQASS